MKSEYIKIFSLLITIFYINIFEINNLRTLNKKKNDDIDNKNDYFRLLYDYDTSNRNNNEDVESIENCEDSDGDYFSYLVSGQEFKFNKYVDSRDSVIKIIIYNIIFIGSTYKLVNKRRRRKQICLSFTYWWIFCFFGMRWIIFNNLDNKLPMLV